MVRMPDVVIVDERDPSTAGFVERQVPCAGNALGRWVEHVDTRIAHQLLG